MSDIGDDDQLTNARKELESMLTKAQAEIAWAKITIDIDPPLDIKLKLNYPPEILKVFLNLINVCYDSTAYELKGVVMLKDGSWLRREVCVINLYEYWEHVVPPKYEDPNE